MKEFFFSLNHSRVILTLVGLGYHIIDSYPMFEEDMSKGYLSAYTVNNC